jgi:diguanylate cyclase (GGDEF)-like protein
MNDQEIQDTFLKQLPEDRREIEIAWNDLRTSKDWNENDRDGLIRSTHRLAGAALTLGYSRMGNAARRVENHLKQTECLDRSALEKLAAALFVEISARVLDEVIEGQQHATQSIKNVPSLQETRSTSLIYLADDDPVLTDTLASQARHFGYLIQTFTRLEDLRAALQREIPAAILMDIMFPEGELAGIETVRSLQMEYNDQLPVFYLSIREDVSARLHAIRTGGKNYFVKPVDIGELVDALDKVIVAEEPEQYRVLIVDDSEVQAKVNAMHLAKAGVNAHIITNPFDALHALEEFIPDLLLLDLYMPECTGLELAQVIRQMKAFTSLPIVYLSAETDREKQLAAVGFGGDDFLTKPIKPDHLISAVTSRMVRYRQLRALMLRDSLTGLYNHTSIRERLGQEIARSARNDQPLAMAMIDIDNFKRVNDTYGHATGDRVLKALTHMFTRRLRQSDIIGRYGGEEFVVILPNTSEKTAFHVIDDLREAFSQVRHISEGQEFSITFSCGLATFPKQQTPASLSEAADRALYTAKGQGRNQVAVSK